MAPFSLNQTHTHTHTLSLSLSLLSLALTLSLYIYIYIYIYIYCHDVIIFFNWLVLYCKTLPISCSIFYGDQKHKNLCRLSLSSDFSTLKDATESSYVKKIFLAKKAKTKKIKIQTKKKRKIERNI